MKARKPGSGRRAKPMRDSILEKVSKPAGMARSDLLCRFKIELREEASATLEAMVGEGLVLRFTRKAAGGRGHDSVRFFGKAVDGQRWQSTPDGRAIPTFKPERQGKGLAPVHEQTAGKAWRKLTAPPGPAKVQGPVQHTVQLMPAFDPRYQCDPKERVIGGFASLGPGRYLDGAA